METSLEDLFAALASAQEAKVEQKVSERTAIALALLLRDTRPDLISIPSSSSSSASSSSSPSSSHHSKASLWFSSDGRSFLTPLQVCHEVLAELDLRGGRVGISELSQALGLESEPVAAAVEELLSPYRRDLYSGKLYRTPEDELLTQHFIENVAGEIEAALQDAGELALPALAERFSLDVDFVHHTVIRPRLGRRIHGHLLESDGYPVLHTQAFVDRHKSLIRGLFSACIRPTAVQPLLKKFGLKERLFRNQVQELCASNELRGNFLGVYDSPVVAPDASYVPNVYSSARTNWARSAFAQNGFVDYSAIKEVFGASDGAQYCMQLYSAWQDRDLSTWDGKSPVCLSTCCTSEVAINAVKDTVSDFAAGGSNLPFLVIGDSVHQYIPSATDEDIQLISGLVRLGSKGANAKTLATDASRAAIERFDKKDGSASSAGSDGDKLTHVWMAVDSDEGPVKFVITSQLIHGFVDYFAEWYPSEFEKVSAANKTGPSAPSLDDAEELDTPMSKSEQRKQRRSTRKDKQAVKAPASSGSQSAADPVAVLETATSLRALFLKFLLSDLARAKSIADSVSERPQVLEKMAASGDSAAVPVIGDLAHAIVRVTAAPLREISTHVKRSLFLRSQEQPVEEAAAASAAEGADASAPGAESGEVGRSLSLAERNKQFARELKLMYGNLLMFEEGIASVAKRLLKLDVADLEISGDAADDEENMTTDKRSVSSKHVHSEETGPSEPVLLVRALERETLRSLCTEVTYAIARNQCINNHVDALNLPGPDCVKRLPDVRGKAHLQRLLALTRGSGASAPAKASCVPRLASFIELLEGEVASSCDLFLPRAAVTKKTEKDVTLQRHEAALKRQLKELTASSKKDFGTILHVGALLLLVVRRKLVVTLPARSVGAYVSIIIPALYKGSDEDGGVSIPTQLARFYELVVKWLHAQREKTQLDEASLAELDSLSAELAKAVSASA